MGRTATGRKKPERAMTSTQRSLASMRKEDTQIDEAKMTGNYARVMYDYREDYYNITVYKNGKEVASDDGYFGANETGNPLIKKFTDVVKKAGLKPEGLPIVDEDGKKGVFKGNTFKWNTKESTFAEEKSTEEQIADIEKMLKKYRGNTSSMKTKRYALEKRLAALKSMKEAKEDPSHSKNPFKYFKKPSNKKEAQSNVNYWHYVGMASNKEIEDMGQVPASYKTYAKSMKQDAERELKKFNEEVELDEAVKTTHVVIDTARGNRVVATASDEKGAQQSINSAERPPMSIKDKNTLKIVKLKKPVGDKQQSRMIGYPLEEAKNYEIKDGKIHISRANFRKVHKDYKNSTKGKERMMALDPKTGGTASFEVVFTESRFDRKIGETLRETLENKLTENELNAYLLENDIDVDTLTEEELEEVLGALARAAGRGIKKVANRMSVSGRADAAEKRAAAAERKNKDRERIAKAQQRLKDAQKAAADRNKPSAAT